MNFSNEIRLASERGKLAKRKKLTTEEAAMHSMQLVKGQLADFFSIEDDEEIVPMRVRPLVVSVTDLATHETQRQIDGYVVALGRKKGNSYFLSGGSSIRVTLAPDGTLLSLIFDWPQYRMTNKKQEIVDSLDISLRKNKILKYISESTRSSITGFSSDTVLCGYHDPGERRRSVGQMIQAACFISGKLGESGEGISMTVPAAQKPVFDATWTELSFIEN